MTAYDVRCARCGRVRSIADMKKSPNNPLKVVCKDRQWCERTYRND